jgi:hypothetical protein
LIVVWHGAKIRGYSDSKDLKRLLLPPGFKDGCKGELRIKATAKTERREEREVLSFISDDNCGLLFLFRP